MSFHLEPAARITDIVRGSVIDDGLYLLIVEGSPEGPSLSTPNPITLDRATGLMRELAQSSTSESVRKARKMGFDGDANVEDS